MKHQPNNKTKSISFEFEACFDWSEMFVLPCWYITLVHVLVSSNVASTGTGDVSIPVLSGFKITGPVLLASTELSIPQYCHILPDSFPQYWYQFCIIPDISTDKCGYFSSQFIISLRTGAYAWLLHADVLAKNFWQNFA